MSEHSKHLNIRGLKSFFAERPLGGPILKLPRSNTDSSHIASGPWPQKTNKYSHPIEPARRPKLQSIGRVIWPSPSITFGTSSPASPLAPPIQSNVLLQKKTIFASGRNTFFCFCNDNQRETPNSYWAALRALGLGLGPWALSLGPGPGPWPWAWARALGLGLGPGP